MPVLSKYAELKHMPLNLAISDRGEHTIFTLQLR